MTNCGTLYPDAPTDFSIRVKESVTGEAGLCIRVDCFFTVPQSVSDPIKRTWFKGDPQNPAVEVPYFSTNTFPSYEKECNFFLNHLVQGKSDGEYRLKLKWGEGKVYIFPQTVNITVKELTQKPTIKVPLLKAGKKAEISCKVPGDCTSPMADIVWTGIYGETSRGGHGVPYQEENFSFMTFLPKPEHHNTKLTCAVTLQGRIRTESTVILKVRCMYHFTYNTSSILI
ncbi:sialic acid-binding Ig-like lectin 7 [Cyprinus carpio]|uniref:Sialic acid-binding Ig-like lectin 7 n=1 Tax=Cyprinus carpio TaxID=7962 RepID=A0A9Q9YXM7_CYPCA|nr:sialic acid-binding Ig-like lectin 7 [Cyprinus carpio]